MGKSFRHEPIRIESEDMPKARRTWGNVRPFSRVEEDKKKRKNRRACREFKQNNWMDNND